MADSEEPEQSANVCIKSRKRKSPAPNLLQNHTSGAKGVDSIERTACASDPRQDRSLDVYRRWVSSSSSSSAPVLFPSESEIDLGRARIPSRGGLTNKTLNSGVPSAEKGGSVCGESSERWWLKEGFLEDEKGRKKNKVSSTTSVGASSVSRMALSPPARDRSSPRVAVGAGWQTLVAYINIGCYYVVGLPLGFLLGSYFDLGIQGIWSGMISGVFLQTLILTGITLYTDWNKEAEAAEFRIKKWGGSVQNPPKGAV